MSGDHLIYLPGAATRVSSDLLGGKGANLARLRDRGFPVPGFFVVTTEAFEKSLVESGSLARIASALSDRPASDEPIEAAWADLCLGAALDPALESGIRGALDSLGPRFVAVRSSANAEDRESRSFAGIFTSCLYLSGFDDVVDGLRRCWASLFSTRALAYLRAARVPPLSLRMAVIVQEMVDSESSGVLFTVDPTTGAPDRMVLDAALGLGEGLVSGKVESDHLVVDKASLAVLEERIAAKDQRIALDAARGKGIVAEPVPPSRRSAPALSGEDVSAIASLGVAIERELGAAQDIEWAIAGGRIFVLQARPITGLAAADSIHIWENANITESYGGLTLPLTYSIVRRFYHVSFRRTLEAIGVSETVLDAIDPGLAHLLGLIDGRIYYNLAHWYQMIFQLPGVRYYQPIWEQALGIRETLPDYARPRLTFRTGPASWTDRLQKLRIALRLARIFFGFQPRIDRFSARVEAVWKEQSSRDLAVLDVPELLGLFRTVEEPLLKEWIEPNLNDLFGFLFVGVLRRLTARWLGSGSPLANDLLAGERDMASVEPALRLAALAERIARNPGARELFAGPDPGGVLAALRRDPDQSELLGEIERYVADFGFRTPEELKFETRDLAEAPEQLVVMIRNCLRAGPSPALLAKKREQSRAEAEQELSRRLSRVKRIVYRIVLRQARRALCNRENTRLKRSQMFALARRILNAAGRALAKRGMLAEPRDLFYLTADELFGLVDGTAVTRDLAGLVALRKRDYAAFALREPADRFATRGLVHEDNTFSAAPDGASQANEELRGTSGGGGRVIGTVKVLASSTDDLSLSGEILAARRTDPGWVTLYPAISGLLVEKGSPVSHSVIVAREMGIPTIVAIPGLTARLRTGDRVLVDADRGVVRKLGSTDRESGEG